MDEFRQKYLRLAYGCNPGRIHFPPPSAKVKTSSLPSSWQIYFVFIFILRIQPSELWIYAGEY